MYRYCVYELIIKHVVTQNYHHERPRGAESFKNTVQSVAYYKTGIVLYASRTTPSVGRPNNI